MSATYPALFHGAFLGLALFLVTPWAHGQEPLPVPPGLEEEPGMEYPVLEGESGVPEPALPGEGLPTFGEPSPGVGIGPEPPGDSGLPNNIQELLRQNPGIFPRGFPGGNLFQQAPEGAPLEEQERTVRKALDDLRNPDPEIRRSACMILGKYSLPLARNGLFTAIQDENALVRRTALVAVLENRPQLSGGEAMQVLPMVADEDVHNRRLASSAIQMMLLATPMQIKPGTHTPVRTFPPPINEKLQGALLDSDLTVRRNMVASLQNLRLDLEDATIAKLLGDSDREIRLGTLTSLGQLRPQAIVAMGPMLLEDREPLVREELVQQLARLHSPASRPLLEKLSLDENLKVSVFAKLGLLELEPSTEGFRKLLPVLNEPGAGSEILRPLVYSISWLPPADAQAVIQDVLKTRSPVYTADALNVYASVVMSSAKPDLSRVLVYVDDALPTIRQAALSVLMRAPRSLSEKDIMGLVTSNHADVRQQTVYLARLLPDEKATDIALELLLDDDVEVRVAALRELSSRQAPNWQTIVTQSLRDDNEAVAQTALEIISSQPSPANLKTLQDFVAEHPQHPLVQLAQQQLFYMRQQLQHNAAGYQAN